LLKSKDVKNFWNTIEITSETVDCPMWNHVYQALQQEIDPDEFHTWLGQVTLRSLKKDRLVLSAPNKFVASWIADHYIRQIQDTFKRIFDLTPKIEIEQRSCPALEKPSSAALFEPPQGRRVAAADLMYTFETFIEAEENRFARALCLQICEDPGKDYNPLYLFSAVSAGKSHLLRAIAHRLLMKAPKIRCPYLTADAFTDSMVHASRNHRLPEWRAQHEAFDGLLIDDLHRFEGREASQKEFLRLFDTYQQTNRLIVLAANQRPNHLTRIIPELRSRLQWGLFAEILPPSQTLKIKILKANPHLNVFEIPEDVLFFLAGDTQDLKTLVERSIALATHLSLQKGPVDLATIRSVIKRPHEKSISLGHIQEITSAHFRIPVSELVSPSKTRRTVYPRQIAMFLARKWTKLSFKDIGKAFGNKDHSTVVHAVQRIENLKVSETSVLDDIRKIETSLV